MTMTRVAIRTEFRRPIQIRVSPASSPNHLNVKPFHTVTEGGEKSLNPASTMRIRGRNI